MSSACTPSLVGIASPVLKLNFPFEPWITDPLGVQTFRFFLNFFNEYHYNHLWYPPTTIIIDCKKALRSKGDQRR